MAAGELACIYASLILHDDGIPITISMMNQEILSAAEGPQAEKISTLVKSANVSVESYWPSLFAKLLEKRNIEDLILSVGSGGGGAPVSVSAPVAGANATSQAAAPAAEEKREEPKEESDDDMGFSLFD